MAPMPIQPIELHIGPGGACEHRVDLTGVCNTTAALPLLFPPGVGGTTPVLNTVQYHNRNRIVSQLSYIYDAL